MKRITMTQFRHSPGEYLLDIIRDGKSYMLTKAGKDVARLLPPSDDIVIGSDGKRISGPELPEIKRPARRAEDAWSAADPGIEGIHAETMCQDWQYLVVTCPDTKTAIEKLRLIRWAVRNVKVGETVERKARR